MTTLSSSADTKAISSPSPAVVAKPTEEDFRRYRIPVYGIWNGEKVTGAHSAVLRWLCTQGNAYQAGVSMFYKGWSFILDAEKHYIRSNETQDEAIRRVIRLYDPILIDGIPRKCLRPVTWDLKVYSDKKEDPPTNDEPEPVRRRYIIVVYPTYSRERMVYPDVRLPDGRHIFIADEHEDCHDPDFCIYNDVKVTYPETWHDTALAGTDDFYLYRPQDFPPTDFHTCDFYRSRDGANHIVILGNLSYKQLRKPGYTPIYILDCGTMQMSQMHRGQSGSKNDLGGHGPGWISWHKTRIVDLETSKAITDYYASSKHHSRTCHEDETAYRFDSTIGIMVYGGRICTEEGFVANRDRWVLDPETGSWNKLEPGHGVAKDSDEEEDSNFANAREEHKMVQALWARLASRGTST